MGLFITHLTAAMIFTPHQVSEDLQSHIESIFHYEAFQPDHSIERLVPTGHVFLLFELDGIERHTFDPESLEPISSHQKVWLSGMRQHHLAISAHQDSEMLVVQFRTAGGLPFVHQPLSNFNNLVIQAEHVFGDGILDLHEQLRQCQQTAAKLTMVEQWLTSRFNHTLAAPHDLLAVVEDLKAQPAAKFSQVIKNYPQSQKHLIDQFKKYVGLTPKYLHRIFRFNDILLKIHQQQTIDWSDVAFWCGFADQPHFIREFQFFSGFNPGDFAIQGLQHELTNFFPLDRG